MFFPPFFAFGGAASIEVSANDASGFGFGPSTSGSVSSTVGPNLTVSGGSGSYTYSWALSGPSSGFSIDNAASQNPSWSDTVSDGIDESELWAVTVTDTMTGAKKAVAILVSLSWVNSS